MGLYDTIMLETQCPYCKRNEERDIQTKDLDQLLLVYRKGDTVPGPLIKTRGCTWLTGIASCSSPQCKLEASKRDLIRQSSISGFGMHWDVRIKIDKEFKITNEVEILEVNDPIPNDWEKKLKYQDEWQQIKIRGQKEKKSLQELIRMYSDFVWEKIREKESQRVENEKKRTEDLHTLLWSIVEKSQDDYEPYGETIRENSDCSCGCKWYLPLKAVPLDWGVCSNKKSHRVGKLTFEHQGCPQFEQKDDELHSEKVPSSCSLRRFCGILGPKGRELYKNKHKEEG